MHQSAPDHLNHKTLILIWDTRASAGLMPFQSDFIDYVECEIDVRDITKVNKVVGIGNNKTRTKLLNTMYLADMFVFLLHRSTAKA